MIRPLNTGLILTLILMVVFFILVSRFAEQNESVPKRALTTETLSQDDTTELENGYLELLVDPERASIISLRVDLQGNGEYGQNILGDAGAIYFGGGSEHQRPIDPNDLDNKFLVTRLASGLIKVSKDKGSYAEVRIDDLELLDPVSKQQLMNASLVIAISGTSFELSAEYTSLVNRELPYIGWHLDFPTGTWDKFYYGSQGYIRYRNMTNIRMSQDVLQPWWRGVGENVLAFGSSENSLTCEFAMRIRATRGYSGWTNINLPNPMFDEPRGIAKIGITYTQLDWSRHNNAEFAFEAGETYHIAGVVEFLSANTKEPEFDVVRLEFPHDTSLTKELNDYWLEHVSGGPSYLFGINAWWYAMVSRYNPRYELSKFRSDIESYLKAAADGKTVKDERGNVMASGKIPWSIGQWTWNNGYIHEVNGHVLLASEVYYLVSQDKDFLERNYTNMQIAYSFYESLDDGTGVIVMPREYTGLVSQGRASTYWDGWLIGHKYSLLQIYYFGATRTMSRIARELGKHNDVQTYDEKAEQIRQRLTEVYWTEDIADNSGTPLPGGRFISWIDVNGKRIDVGFTDLNLIAIYLGATTEEQTQKILTWIDNDPHAYAWKDSETGKSVGLITFNTIDGNKNKMYAGIHNPFAYSPGMENGQVQYWVGGFDWAVKAQNGMASRVYELVKNFESRHLRGDLTSGDGLPTKVPGRMFQGTSTMSVDDVPCGSDASLSEDGLVYTLAFINGIGGVVTDYDGLKFRPSIPYELRDMKISNLRYGKYRLDIQFEGWGQEVEAIYLNHNEVSRPIMMKDLQGGSVVQRIRVIMRGS